MKAMEDGGRSAGGLVGDTGGRHTRALAKRCIVLTEENSVRDIVKHMLYSSPTINLSGGTLCLWCSLRME